MYTEPFKFTFTETVPDSKRMELLSEMFKLSETKNIKGESYGGYKINNLGVVSFWSYHPDITSLVVNWLEEKQSQGELSIAKPTYASKQNA